MFHAAVKNGLEGRYLAPKLSHQRRPLGGHEIFSSLRSECTHISSTIAFAIDLYSSSVLNHETVSCFLALQDMRLESKNTVNPPVDL
jgi:hypothetical protein